MCGPALFDNDLARQVSRSAHRCDLVDVVDKELPTHSVMGSGLRQVTIVGEPEADWSALHGKEPREFVAFVYRLEPEAAEEVTLGVGVSHIQDRVERAHGHDAIITQDPSKLSWAVGIEHRRRSQVRNAYGHAREVAPTWYKPDFRRSVTGSLTEQERTPIAAGHFAAALQSEYGASHRCRIDAALGHGSSTRIAARPHLEVETLEPTGQSW
jgi:hypothetical protein